MLEAVENDQVAVVITKDLSRFGRNSALTGMYINFVFAQHGVRYIAINDNYDTIDPNSVDNDFAGIQNWFNEFYARDTSRKIRAVNKAKGERGEHLTVFPPYGYIKDPENPKQWIIDDDAAKSYSVSLPSAWRGAGRRRSPACWKKHRFSTPPLTNRNKAAIHPIRPLSTRIIGIRTR